MKIELTLDEAYARAGERLRKKMEYSIRLLQKAERLALAYDQRGGVLPCFQRRKGLASPAAYRPTGGCTIRGAHEPDECRSARGDKVSETALPRSGTYQTQGEHLPDSRREDPATHTASALVLRGI